MVIAAFLSKYLHAGLCHFVQQGPVTFKEYKASLLLKKVLGKKASKDLKAYF